MKLLRELSKTKITENKALDNPIDNLWLARKGLSDALLKLRRNKVDEAMYILDQALRRTGGDSPGLTYRGFGGRLAGGNEPRPGQTFTRK